MIYFTLMVLTAFSETLLVDELLFKGGRGRMKATLDAQKPKDTPVFFEKKDRTLPDVIVGEPGPQHA